MADRTQGKEKPSAAVNAQAIEGPGGQYHIRILADGSVVFGDLPAGLAEVAAVVAGSETVGLSAVERSDES